MFGRAGFRVKLEQAPNPLRPSAVTSMDCESGGASNPAPVGSPEKAISTAIAAVRTPAKVPAKTESRGWRNAIPLISRRLGRVGPDPNSSTPTKRHGSNASASSAATASTTRTRPNLRIDAQTADSEHNLGVLVSEPLRPARTVKPRKVPLLQKVGSCSTVVVSQLQVRLRGLTNRSA